METGNEFHLGMLRLKLKVYVGAFLVILYVLGAILWKNISMMLFTFNPIRFKPAITFSNTGGDREAKATD